MATSSPSSSPRKLQFHLARTAWLFMLIIGTSSGCSRERPPALQVYPVAGEVFVDGKPAEGAVIAFHPLERTEWKSATSRGIVNRDGGFSLTTYAANDGAPEGEYIVTVYWPERLLNPDGEGDSLPADKLQYRFAKSGQSNLRAILGREPVKLARVDLKDQAAWGGTAFYFEEQGP